MRGQNFAENNGMWKGDKVGYGALHQWVKKRFPETKLCQNCKKAPPYDLANISQQYKRDLSDWEWLCRSCHMGKDGRLDKFKTVNNGRDKLQGKWSSYYKCCKNCQSTSKNHRAYGYCTMCYQKLSLQGQIPKNKWSKYYILCKECKTSEVKHSAFGYCYNCYKRQYNHKYL